MQAPCNKSAGMSTSVVECALLQQLSQDLLDAAPPQQQRSGGCDSSDCLICQGQRQFCNQAITESVCAWLGRRRQQSGCGTAVEPVCSSQQSAPAAAAATQQPYVAEQEAHHQQQEPRRKRLKPSHGGTPASTPACSAGSPSADLSTTVPAHSLRESLACAIAQQQLQGMHMQQQQEQDQDLQDDSTMQPTAFDAPAAAGQPLSDYDALQPPCRSSSSTSWQWQPEFAAFEGPAPARFTEVARLQSAADASAGHCLGRCDRVSGLEFSPDGQLLAAAGVSKQVGLYPLASLAELQEDAAAAEAQDTLPGGLGSSCSSQRTQRTAQQSQQQPQQQQSVLLLPPVATVRLPGKVSSIAFSPDMQGVISIGDYDGTLTQVHVASGHYLNEVDAHAGRRIWSVCHSKLRRHFAVTASDDCTARLWSGSGLDTHIATVTAPGKPAICGADLSSSNEYLLALAAADARVYLYDMRQLLQPVVVLHGHRRPVAYAKFFGSQQLVSASIDGTLAVWDLGQALGTGGSGLVSAASAAGPIVGDTRTGPSPTSSTCCSSDGSCWQPQQQQHVVEAAAADSRAGSGSCRGAPGAAAVVRQQPLKVFRGHANERNFVGLSVDPCSGLMAVGSETPEVFSYHTSWDRPLARFDMAAAQQQEQARQGAAVKAWEPPQAQQVQQQSVSAVAWQPGCAGAAARAGCAYAPSTLLAAATSAGMCRLLSLRHPEPV